MDNNLIYRYMKESIDDAIKHFPILLLTGPRQIEKTTLLYNEYVGKDYKYISLDNSLQLALAKHEPKSFLKGRFFETFVFKCRNKTRNILLS